jgi:hypothetical protein
VVDVTLEQTSCVSSAGMLLKVSSGVALVCRQVVGLGRNSSNDRVPPPREPADTVRPVSQTYGFLRGSLEGNSTVRQITLIILHLRPQPRGSGQVLLAVRLGSHADAAIHCETVGLL